MLYAARPLRMQVMDGILPQPRSAGQNLERESLTEEETKAQDMPPAGPLRLRDGRGAIRKCWPNRAERCHDPSSQSFVQRRAPP